MTSRRTLSWAAASVGALALLAGCGTTGPMTPEQDPSESAPESATRFHEQQVDFEPCDRAAPETGVELPDVDHECGVLEVPLDHAAPDGPTAQIALLRVPARGGDPIGSLVLNPGGPGFPGTEHALLAAQVWAQSPLTEKFDLVGFDPRGVGRSTPAVDCYTDAEREAGATLLTFDDGDVEARGAAGVGLFEQCADRSGGAEALEHLGTRDAARDLDVLRAALGDEGLTFVGSSYGTRLGAVYAEMFPQNVRALVLDGAMDPLASVEERRLQQAAGMQATFERMATACTEQAGCPLGDDPESTVEEFQSLVRPLIDTPVAVGDGRELTFNTAIGGVITGMYSEVSWPAVTAGIAELREGRGETLLALADLYQGRTPDGSYADDLEASLAISCLDENRVGVRESAALTEALFEAAPFLDTGRPAVEYEDLCHEWPVEPTLGIPYATDVEGLPETMTIGATGDPMTPMKGADNLAELLDGSLLTVEGNQHGVVFADSGCIQDALHTYLVDLEAPREGATCPL
ncbi:carboxylesterase [Oerskovia sp. Root918]|nr:carboxylesterase [Oerskovia sp. Root918]